MHGRGLPCWWVFPLEMLCTCTFYSRLHWRWFESRVTFLLHNMALSCPCTFQDLTGPRVGSQLFHLSGFYWHTCRILVGAGVTSSLDHMLHFYWSMWHDHNTPRVFLLLDHMSRCCTSACQYFNGPRVTP
jgi:hypothetical protein